MMRRALAIIACVVGLGGLGAAPALAETAAQARTLAYTAVTNDCLRYQSCHGITLWQTFEYTSGGLYGTDTNYKFCFYFYTAFSGTRFATYTYHDRFLRSDTTTYVQPAATCGAG